MEITQEEAKTWAVDTKSIYDPTQTMVDTVGKINEGPIADLGAARELAGIEATQGRDTALIREAALEREAKTGLTDEQRKIADFLQSIKEKTVGLTDEKKYAHALQEFIDSKGNTYAVTYPEIIPPQGEQVAEKMGAPGNMIVFDVNHAEVLFVTFKSLSEKKAPAEIPKSLDWDRFRLEIDAVGKRMDDMYGHNVSLTFKGEMRQSIERVVKIDLSDEENMKAVARAMGNSERFGKELQEKNAKPAFDPKVTVDKYF